MYLQEKKRLTNNSPLADFVKIKHYLPVIFFMQAFPQFDNEV